MAGWCRRFRWPPFFGEIRIDPIAKPCFFVSPTQPFGDEDFADPAALHANAFDSMQVVHQPIQRPGSITLFTSIPWPGESRLDDFAHQLRLIGGRSTRARRFFQSQQSLLIEAVEPIAYHPLTDFKLLGDLRRQQSL